MNVSVDGTATEKVHSYEKYDTPPGGLVRAAAADLVNEKIYSNKVWDTNPNVHPTDIFPLGIVG
jgi:hypothetical protein